MRPQRGSGDQILMLYSLFNWDAFPAKKVDGLLISTNPLLTLFPIVCLDDF
jgi:hypothetical protein